MGKRVPLVFYKDGERIEIGTAYVEDSGLVTGSIDDAIFAKELGFLTSDLVDPNKLEISVGFRADLQLGKLAPDEARIISGLVQKEDSLDPNNGKLYNSVDEAKEDGVEHPVEISGRKKEIAFVSKSLSAADKKRQKKQKKNAKATRKRNR